jgi:hypothetical protein
LIRYTGGFVNDKKEGKGEIIYSKGDRYVGDF